MVWVIVWTLVQKDWLRYHCRKSGYTMHDLQQELANAVAGFGYNPNEMGIGLTEEMGPPPPGLAIMNMPAEHPPVAGNTMLYNRTTTAHPT